MRKTWKKKYKNITQVQQNSSLGIQTFLIFPNPRRMKTLLKRWEGAAFVAWATDETKLWLRQNSCEILALRSPPPAVYQDLSTCHDWSIKCRFVNQNKRKSETHFRIVESRRCFADVTETGIYGISLGFWETAHLPLPYANINTYFSFRAKCWFRGGVGGQFPTHLNWSDLCTY